MTTASNVRVIPARPQTAEHQNPHRQIRVAAYCRVSTEMEEQQNSYQVQIDYYTDLINKKKEWTLAGIFADEGISGTQTKKRTEFNRMIRMCRRKKIDLVITKSISRFARNTVDCLEYVRQLKDLGIGVIFEKENINTLTMTSEFMIALYGSFAQAESESISKNVSLGVQMAFREGKARIQYRNLLGYRKGTDDKPEIVPAEAETVKLIFKLFLDGLSTQKIADALIAKERPNASGDLAWNSGMVRKILHNEKYVGDVLLQKTYTVDCITHKKAVNHGERTMYLVSDHHDPIIDRITYNLVQQELTGLGQSEIQAIEKRLKEIDAARSDLISLITSGACDEDTLDSEFAKLYEEETQLSEKLLSLKAQANADNDTQKKIESTLAEIENEKFELKAFDDVLIRKLIECVKVMSKTELLIIFKGGYEVRAEIEK